MQLSLKPVSHAYLSLGSNLGNRFGHLQAAVGAVFENVGNIVGLSSVYESTAVGFTGPAFLNCALHVTTQLSPDKLLGAVLAIEKGLGRRRGGKGYTSRTIDIDILLIDDKKIASKKLTVPHPRMPDRSFVLQPLAEVAPNLLHPVLQKKIGALLAGARGKSGVVKQAGQLHNPQRDLDISKYNYIAIEGNIGAGKTSLATKMAHGFNAKLILERFKQNPFLPKFYGDPARFAFPLEMSFLADRYQQLLEDIAQFDLFKDCVVADYSFYKSYIFAKITLPDEEFNLYKKLFGIMQKELPRPDRYVYLYQTPERLLQHIKKRGRTYEREIKPPYLSKINNGYFEHIKTLPAANVKTIDISEMDFMASRKDYLHILREIVSG